MVYIIALHCRSTTSYIDPQVLDTVHFPVATEPLKISVQCSPLSGIPHSLPLHQKKKKLTQRQRTRPGHKQPPPNQTNLGHLSHSYPTGLYSSPPYLPTLSILSILTILPLSPAFLRSLSFFSFELSRASLNFISPSSFYLNIVSRGKPHPSKS